MKRRRFLGAAAAAPFAAALFAQPDGDNRGTWKAGFARAKITPARPFWMAGFGDRTRPAEGSLHDLWIKVLALEDGDGRLGIILTSDLLGIHKDVYEQIVASVGKKHGIKRDQLMLTASHTHSGPVLRGALYDIYPLDERQHALIGEYTDFLTKTIEQTIDRAMAARIPVTLWAGSGRAEFAMNRRTNNEANLPDMIRRGEKPKGPSDFDVPALAVRDADGKLLAAVFGYAAHTSALCRDPYQYSGDYAGVCQTVLEEKYPGAQAMFFQGCGSDQSVVPRGTLERCLAIGRQLAAAVEAVIEGEMRPVDPRLRTAFEFVPLDFEPAASEHLQETAKLSTYQGRWAKRLLGELTAGKTFAKSYPEYPVQVWMLGKDQLWIALGGEVAVDYSLLFKQQFGPKTWVAGYTNDVMAYIPSRRIWEEGGYQAGAFEVYGLPAVRWTPGIQERITSSVDRLAAKLKVKQENGSDAKTS